MQIRVGFELIYRFPQPTPMIMTVDVHYSRASDILSNDGLATDPSVPIAGYRDGFGNWCSRILAPAGQVRITNGAVVRDSGMPDVVVPAAWQQTLQRSARRDFALLFWAAGTARQICCPNSRGICSASPLPGMATRTGGLRLCPQPYRVRLSEGARHKDGLGNLQGANGCLPGLLASRNHVLPLPEYSGALLHRLPGRHGYDAALWRRRLRRMV